MRLSKSVGGAMFSLITGLLIVGCGNNAADNLEVVNEGRRIAITSKNKNEVKILDIKLNKGNCQGDRIVRYNIDKDKVLKYYAEHKDKAKQKGSFFAIEEWELTVPMEDGSEGKLSFIIDGSGNVKSYIHSDEIESKYEKYSKEIRDMFYDASPTLSYGETMTVSYKCKRLLDAEIITDDGDAIYTWE